MSSSLTEDAREDVQYAEDHEADEDDPDPGEDPVYPEDPNNENIKTTPTYSTHV